MRILPHHRLLFFDRSQDDLLTDQSEYIRERSKNSNDFYLDQLTQTHFYFSRLINDDVQRLMNVKKTNHLVQQKKKPLFLLSE